MSYERLGTHLVIEGLGKSFGTNNVLKELNLEVKPGEFVAIVGRSGCGKSTLLRLIAGLETPSAGGVLLDGQRTQRLNPTVRMMFQDARLLPWQRVLANVELGLLGAVGSQPRALQVLQSVGLEEKANEWPAALSGGQRQRVALARALASQPHLLLLDEPLGALDALTRIEMQQLLEDLWQEQQFTSLLITHDVEEAVALADRVILIEHGEVVMDIPVDLPRPRHRASAAFAATVEIILQRVMRKNDLSVETLVGAQA
ncbi:ATP-binding cassette domain-containing protein [Alkalinema sp. FACHB-956]|uniref:ATP-binding cassette domain-containing protein n=1 Tax=Alkalinema sp. FACHB-956 TaxID=2692768 RepID=UPI0016832615|nr:ATP-binding cassette domain-containing protein [Alkalinema sp. FACHB-956]MBD2329252.1 ATP-binding cassette domain-containing protein [Alkalinema sp. FACHB-956]